MKYTLLFIITFGFVLDGFAQVNSLEGKVAGVNVINQKPVADSIYVFYKDKSKKKTTLPEATYFLNGKEIESAFVRAIQPNQIESVSVEKKTESGEILIKTKGGVNPAFINLEDLSKKYLDVVESDKKVFMLDGKLVNTVPAEFWVDEDFILKIEVEKIAQLSPSTFMISVFTRTEENLERFSPTENIIIR